jgi:hypothetical protein
VIIDFTFKLIFIFIKQAVSGIAHNPHGSFEYSSIVIRWQVVSVPSSSPQMPVYPVLLSGLALHTKDIRGIDGDQQRTYNVLKIRGNLSQKHIILNTIQIGA